MTTPSRADARYIGAPGMDVAPYLGAYRVWFDGKLWCVECEIDTPIEAGLDVSIRANDARKELRIHTSADLTEALLAAARECKEKCAT